MPKLNDVNTNDIAAAIRLGCRTMHKVFDADDGGVPFFRSLIEPETLLAFSAAHSEAHVPGRHLNARGIYQDNDFRTAAITSTQREKQRTIHRSVTRTRPTRSL